MTARRTHLPQLDAEVFLTDGGLETTLIFDDGLELPDIAAFLLLAEPDGRAALVRYFDRYAEIARRDRVGLVLETPTWRANPDWGARQGYGVAELARANRDGVELLTDVRSRWETPETPVVISGCIGPRGDGYRPDDLMSPDQARTYHSEQIQVFADAGADLVTSMTITYPAEAIGLTEAARSAGMPIVVSFTVETDGRYMVNCTPPHPLRGHPRHDSTLGTAHPRHPGQCIATEPRRARRGRGTGQWRSHRTRCRLPRTALEAASTDGAGRLLRHEPRACRCAQHGRSERSLTMS